MKRRVRSAIHCAGVDIPYGQVYAIGPEIVRTGGVAPKRPNWPCASARYTTTQVAKPATIAAAALPIAPDPPPPPPPQNILVKRNSGRPSAVATRIESLRSLLYDAMPSMAVTGRPASSAAR